MTKLFQPIESAENETKPDTTMAWGEEFPF